MKKFLARALLVAIVTATYAFSLPAPARADGFGHDAVIKFAKESVGARVLKVCRNWANDNSGCAAKSPKKKLAEGQNSKKKFKWPDADGVYLPKGCSMTAVGRHLIRVTASGGKNGKWVKLGGLAGGTWVVVLECHLSGFSGGEGNGGGGGGGW